MAHLSDKAKELVDKYKEKFDKPPRCWNHGVETMKEYEKYLDEEIKKN